MISRVLHKEWLLLPSPANTGRWASALLYLAVYVVLEWASFIHIHKGLPVTPWDPGLGVAFALMMRGGGALGAFVLFAGMTIAEVLVLRDGGLWPLIVGVAGITALSYASVAALAQRHLRIDTELIRLRDVLMLLAAGLAGAAIDTILLSAFLLAVGQLDMHDVVQNFRPLLIGDAIGIAVMTPLLLRLGNQRIASHRLRSLAPEGALYLLLIGVTLWAIFGSEHAHGFTLFYLLFVPVVIAAVRHGLDGACFSLAITQFGLIGILHLSGYGALEFTEFQTLMMVLTVTGLIVGVVVSERQSSDRIARDAQARLLERQAGAAQVARVNLVSGMASALAHEINQPMTAARALGRSAQHLMRTPGGDLARADNNLSTMLTHIDHAGDIVRRMRNFIRRGHPHVSTINTRSMIEEALTLAYAEAATRHVRIEVDTPDDLPDLHADSVQLEQVVLNLVHNAVDAIAQAGQSEGVVRVVARRHDSPARVEIGVLDNGPGVEGELAESLFDPLTTSKQDGLGLGLSISASIVEAHGGRVWLQSGQPGATEFRFSLPLDPPRAP